MNKKILITHYFTSDIVNGLPKSGLRHLSYINMTDAEDDKGEYFLQTDNNPLDVTEIQDMEREKKIKRFPETIELPHGKSLWISPNGEFTIADREKSAEDVDKKSVFTLEYVDSALFITHFFRQELPLQGLAKVLFMAASEWWATKYYLDGDRDSHFNSEHISKKLSNGILIPMPEIHHLPKGKDVYLDSLGNIWIANQPDPSADKTSLRIERSFAAQLYDELKPLHPEICEAGFIGTGGALTIVIWFPLGAVIPDGLPKEYRGKKVKYLTSE